MQIYQYELPLEEGAPLKERSGLLVRTDRGWGEIAPLPGRSQETLAQALHQLKNPPHTQPSVRFGLDILKTPAFSLPLNAYLAGTPSQIRAQAKIAKEKGFTYAKIKLSSLEKADAHEIICELKEQFRLRLDINRAWSLHEATTFFSPFDKEAFDYIEEPVANPQDLFQFTHPFALDETLETPYDEKLLLLPLLKTLILKPTLHGGLSTISSYLRYGKKIVLSSTYESGVGTYQIAAIAYHLNLTHIPMGLDTYKLLQEDVLKSPLKIVDGALHLPSQLDVDIPT